MRDDDTALIEAMTTFLSTTTKYFDLPQASVRTQVNESPNSRRTRLASKNLAWADSWMARMSLTVLHFNDPYVSFADLVQKIGSDLPESYCQSLHELFVRSIETHQQRTEERTRSVSVGRGPGPGRGVLVLVGISVPPP
jgi:hypothetical protein